MPKPREITRENKKKSKEELLDSKNSWGNNDPTPKQAVKNIKYGIAQ